MLFQIIETMLDGFNYFFSILFVLIILKEVIVLACEECSPMFLFLYYVIAIFATKIILLDLYADINNQVTNSLVSNYRIYSIIGSASFIIPIFGHIIMKIKSNNKNNH